MLLNKIMVVEDDKQLNDLYSTVLKKAGFETVQAMNGEDACYKLESEHVHMIITDIMMPAMDGYSLVEAIRAYDSAMPILMITAKDDFPSKQKGFNVGADDYMTKPVDVNEMVLRVKALLRRANILNEHMLTIGNTVLPCQLPPGGIHFRYPEDPELPPIKTLSGICESASISGQFPSMASILSNPKRRAFCMVSLTDSDFLSKERTFPSIQRKAASTDTEPVPQPMSHTTESLAIFSFETAIQRTSDLVIGISPR